MPLLFVILLYSYSRRCGDIFGSNSTRCHCRCTGRYFTGKGCDHTISLLRGLISCDGNASGTRRDLFLLNLTRCGTVSCRDTSLSFAGCFAACPGNGCSRLTYCFVNRDRCVDAPRPHLSRARACTTVGSFRSCLSVCPSTSGGRIIRSGLCSLRSGLIIGRLRGTGLCCSLNACFNGYNGNRGGCSTYVVATRGTLGSFPCASQHRSFTILVLGDGCRLTNVDASTHGLRHCRSTRSRTCNFVGRCPSSGDISCTHHIVSHYHTVVSGTRGGNRTISSSGSFLHRVGKWTARFSAAECKLRRIRDSDERCRA